MTDSGIPRRLARVFPRCPTIILPVDDALISGPVGALADMKAFLSPVLLSQVHAILGFRGLMNTCRSELLRTAFIMNISGSTTMRDHTSKVVVASVEAAARLGADAVAYHVNLSSSSEGSMLRDVARVIEEGDRWGMPAIVIAYPRRESETGGDDNYIDLRSSRQEEYAELVQHCVRVAVELGASAVKTVYTGDRESFRSVIKVACGVPVLAAGGPPRRDEDAIQCAVDAVGAGASGVAFGRQVFLNKSPVNFLRMLRKALDSLNTSGEDRSGDTIKL